MRRYIAITGILGAILLTCAPIVRAYDRRVYESRHDVATVAYFMRSDISMACLMGGTTLTGSSLFAWWLTRKTRGRLAAMKRGLAAYPMLIFAVMNIAGVVVTLPFLGNIYRSGGEGIVVNPISMGTYESSKYTAMGAACVVFMVIFWWHSSRVKSLQSRFEPSCQECGYSLRMLESNTCPECGTLCDTDLAGPDDVAE